MIDEIIQSINDIPKNDLISVLLGMIISIVILFIYTIWLRYTKKESRIFVNIYAGGVQRMTDYLQTNKLFEDYQKFSAEKYGDKKSE